MRSTAGHRVSRRERGVDGGGPGRRRGAGSFGVALVGVVVLGVGCTADSGATVPSSSVPADDIELCSEVYEAGETLTEGEFGLACKTEDGHLVSPMPIRIQCEDDRVLLWNDIGWGYVGDPLTLTPAEQVSKMPSAALEECLAGPADRPTTTA